MAEIRDVATVARVVARMARAVDMRPKPMICRRFARMARAGPSRVHRRARVPASACRRGRAHPLRCASARLTVSTLSILGKAIEHNKFFVERVR